MARYSGYLLACVQLWALRDWERRGRRQQIKLLYCTVKPSSSGGGWTATGEALEWARRNRPELVKVAETLKTVEAKRVLTFDEATGLVVDPRTSETVPGITVAPRTVTATVDIEDAS